MVGDIDGTDRQILHALGVNGRVPFRQLAEVLGASEHTIARRYRRLVERGIVRVVAVEAPRDDDQGQLLRLFVHPGSGAVLAKALARRDDVSWVRTGASGAELLCGVRAGTKLAPEVLVFEQLPKTGRVIGVTSHAVLHHFRTPGRADWEGFPDPLTDEQRRAIADHRVTTDVPPPLEPRDAAILAALALDARQPSAQLARATRQPESTVRRQVDQLLVSGAIRLDRDIDPAVLGYGVIATLYVDVSPKHLERAGDLLARHAQTAFVAAVTGPTNLYAAVAVRTLRELYDYVAITLADVEGVLRIETSLTSPYLKHARVVHAFGRPSTRS